MKKIVLSLIVLFNFNSAKAWVYIPGAVKCGEWFQGNAIETQDLSARANGTGNWMLLCRGKRDHQVSLTTGTSDYPNYGMIYNRLDRAAGSRGENLAPGQCAWPDRGLMPTESNSISIEVGCNPIISQKLVSLPTPPFSPPSIGPNGVVILASPLSFLQDENAVYGVFVRESYPGGGWTAVINRAKASPIYRRPL